MYETILLPTDGSGQAARAADHAFDVAARYGARVHALSVIDSSLVQSRELLAALEAESERATRTATRRGQETGVDVVTSVWKGVPDRCITTYAAERSVDLIAVGAHPKRGLDRFLTPDVATRVVRQADCPVATFRRLPTT